MTAVCGLPFGELEALSSSRLTGLLPFHRARVSGQKTLFPQFLPVPLIGFEQRPSDAQAQRTRLAGQPTPVHPCPYIERSERVRSRESLLNVLDQRTPRKIITESPTVDVPLSGTGGEVDPGDSRLAAPKSLPTKFRLFDSHYLSEFLAQEERGRSLRLMWMPRPGIHFELLAKNLAAERPLGKHTEHCLLNNALWMCFEHSRHRRELLVADITRVTEVLLLLHLPPGQTHLFRVNNHHEVTAIHVRRERRLVLSPNDLGYLAGKASQNQAVGINYVPIVLDLSLLEHVCLHYVPTRTTKC